MGVYLSAKDPHLKDEQLDSSTDTNSAFSFNDLGERRVTS